MALQSISQVGIGTNNPQATLEVAGTVRITNLSVGNTNEITFRAKNNPLAPKYKRNTKGI